MISFITTALKGHLRKCLLGVALCTPLFVGIISNPAWAEDSSKKPAKTKSQYNSNLYEAEATKEDIKSFTGKVRVVRDISEDIEVLFEGNDAKGIYSLSRTKANFAAMLKSLEASKKAGGPSVTVSADSDKNIKSVELNKGGGSAGSQFVPPSDPNQKWDFGKVPD